MTNKLSLIFAAILVSCGQSPLDSSLRNNTDQVAHDKDKDASILLGAQHSQLKSVEGTLADTKVDFYVDPIGGKLRTVVVVKIGLLIKEDIRDFKIEPEQTTVAYLLAMAEGDSFDLPQEDDKGYPFTLTRGKVTETTIQVILDNGNITLDMNIERSAKVMVFSGGTFSIKKPLPMSFELILVSK